ncbi:hypothetical protein BO83DRAFT_409877 [Aspergillus eucalypticola CBS 122712]|uniref:PWI domain-containing protein n=1 Tax=Aspergillus eucalypticola (strain CBS 122712 / IBT 29274) TaxID=1448314 RepID=A0A317V1Y6_ASPEC|nr:uncharacterized protein BO83DRAFT_409877 [Aspergillus eucalypticola CBS 122712]PWY68324.1 hypothetical protein BO83DRAFT_409877 [Aspergillus eucalypticola CBS 122712]
MLASKSAAYYYLALILTEINKLSTSQKGKIEAILGPTATPAFGHRQTPNPQSRCWLTTAAVHAPVAAPIVDSSLAVGSLELGLGTMATSVDAKLLKQTKFPPEFSRKVDMTKVNIEVMKKWIAGKISEILGNEDDVVIELCFNLLEGSRFPDIKSLQIQLTGFLDKDTGKFCKELWSLCLSAQENPQGVPKELLEAKKLELIQEKRKEPPRKPANRRNRSARESENLKTFDVENDLSAQGEEEEAVAAVVETLIDVGRLRDSAAVTVSEVRLADESSTPTCPQALVEAVGHPVRPAALALAPCLPRAHLHHVGAILATTGTDDVGQLAALSPRTAVIAGGPGDAALITSQKRPTETEIRFFPQCIAFTCPQRPTQEKRFFGIKVPFEARKSRDDRRLSRSREHNDTRRRRYSSQSVSRSRSRGRSRSASQDSRSRSRSRSRSHSRVRDRKRRRSIERYAPVARRRRNTSSVSVPSDKRKRMADEDEDAAKRSPPPAEKPSSSDHEMKDATETAAPPNNAARARISSSELREKLLREKIIAMRRTASSDKVGSSHVLPFRAPHSFTYINHIPKPH